MVTWLSIPKYSKRTNMSREMIQQLIDKGELIAEQTEGGQWRVKVDENPEIVELKDEIFKLKSLVSLLCNHLGVNTVKEEVL